MILFPHTTIFSAKQFPLLLLTPQLTILQGWKSKGSHAIEVTKQQTIIKVIDCFTKENFCQVEYPAPFIDENEEYRFSHLLSEIILRRDDYTRQLGALSLAAMTAEEENGEHSKSAIIKSIEGKTDDATEENNKKNNRWQARLILAVSELLDTEQEAIDRELEQLDKSTQALFTELHGGSSDVTEEKDFQKIFRKNNTASQEKIEHLAIRVAAWQTLFKEYREEKKKQHRILITQNQDAAELCPEVEHIIPLSLPALIAENPEIAIQRIKSFHELYGLEITSHITCLLERPREKEKITQAIENIMEKEFPTTKDSTQYNRSSAYLLL